MSRHESGPGLPLDADNIARFIRDFEACNLPKSCWTHQAHLLVGLWYLSNFSPTEALGIASHMACHRDKSLPESLALLLKTPLAHSGWPLAYYSRELVYAALARRQWVPPDLQRTAQDDD